MSRNVCKIHGNGKKKESQSLVLSDLLKLAIRHKSDTKEGTMACRGALWVIDDCTRRGQPQTVPRILYTSPIAGHS